MKKLVVLGGGESGVGAALLGKAKNFEVFVSDKGKLKEKYKAELANAGIPYEEGQHDEVRIKKADIIVKSPGIPDTVPLIQELNAMGIPVISEIEFAAPFTRATIVAITGSNGKTTTTCLTHHLLKTAGLKAALGGNVGTSFARNILTGPYDYHVLELSSFQLDGIQKFRPDVAMLLNITPDHLDRYDYKMERYIASKMRIQMNQQAGDLFLYNAMDTNIQSAREKATANTEQIAIDDSMVEQTRLNVAGHTFDLTNCAALRGPHNALNALFAIHAAIHFGASAAAIQKGLETFVNVPHRLELVGEIEGVSWYNDSKATNVDAVYYALRAMTRPLVWIVGGQDKGNDYDPLLPLVEEKVHSIVCMGIDNEKLKNVFGKKTGQLYEARSAAEAVQLASKLARPGDAVLLSPACASFDLFVNYEQRGDLFRAAVLELNSSKA